MNYLRFIMCSIITCSIFAAIDLEAQQKSTKVTKKETFPKTLELKNMFSGEKPAWEMSADEFEKSYGSFFKWLEKDKKEGARFNAINNPRRILLFGMRVLEAVVRFEDGKFNRISVSLYNRGDAQVSIRVTKDGITENILTPEQFKELIKKSDKKVNEWIGVEGKALPPKKLVGSTRDLIYEKYWVKGYECAGLQWSLTKHGHSFNPEYIKFTYSKYDPHNDPRKIMTRNRNMGKLSKAKDIKDNVKIKDGFTYIDNIPMVDQGPKGYCAVATTERILKYYGSKIDQHTIAQLVDTRAGTNPVKMIRMMKKATPKLGIKIYTYLEPPDFANPSGRDIRKYIKEIEGFNKMLKKEREGGVPLAYPIVAQTRGTRLQLFKEYKCIKHKADFKRFKANIKKNIDQGIPVVWGLFVGIVPENKKPATHRMGGHMRLIIGYNKDLSELVFTDTWGAGHEFKTIKTDDAWIVTSFYGIFKPK